MTPSRSTQRLHDFARSLAGMSVDDVAVEDASAAFEPRPDVGDTIIRIRLHLSDPPGRRLTWPLDALQRLEREIRGRAYDSGFEEFVYVNFGKANAEDDEADESPDDRPGPSRAPIPLADERPELT